MTDNPQHGSEERDRVLARLLTEALRADAAPGATSPDCPDAELLAAYADRSLDADQTAHWESHFAGCGRCRKILAVLTVSAEEPLAQEEVKRLGQRIAAVSVPGASVPSKQPVVLRPRRTLRWLVPALGAAAAVIFWFALHPENPPADLVSQNVAPGNSVSPDVPAPDLTIPTSPFSDSGVAQGEVPTPPVSTFAPGTTLQSPAGQSPAADSASALGAARQEQPGSAAPAAASPEPLVALNSARAAAPILAPAAPRERLLVPPAGDALTAAKTAPAGVSGNAAPTGLLDGQRAAQSQNLAVSSRNLAADFARTAVPAFTFAAPGGVLWRGGAGGLIERSMDQGRTWQAQSSGVTLDLAAGAATSNQVAWIVGHGGVILRTTDGVSWQRIFSPNAATTDWTGVTPTDAQHATITSKDQHRFTTTDGGQTWTAQQ